MTQREGLVWHPTAAVSLYANYTENFGITPGLYVSASGNLGLSLPQQAASEWETGVKFERPDGNAAATLAWFNLTKVNISSPLLEPALNRSGALFLTGAARNQGLEVDLRGEIATNLQLRASYAYIESSISNPDGEFASHANGLELIGDTGNRVFGVPRHSGSLWSSYQFTDGPFHGLKLGAGAITRGRREGDNANDYELPGFTKWSALAAYSWPVQATRVSIQFNADNIFNKRYFESLSGTHTVMPQYPRRWMGSLRMEF